MTDYGKLARERTAKRFIERFGHPPEKEAIKFWEQVGKPAGEYDLEHYGFGSDILASIHAMPFPLTMNEALGYAKGYIKGSKIAPKSAAFEIDKIKRSYDKYGHVSGCLSAKNWQGLSRGKKPSDFNQTELKRGTKVETEHTKNKQIAMRIAMDHLVEDPRYYQKLARIERR
jgi:hypothetical protein